MQTLVNATCTCFQLLTSHEILLQRLKLDLLCVSLELHASILLQLGSHEHVLYCAFQRRVIFDDVSTYCSKAILLQDAIAAQLQLCIMQSLVSGWQMSVRCGRTTLTYTCSALHCCCTLVPLAVDAHCAIYATCCAHTCEARCSCRQYMLM